MGYTTDFYGEFQLDKPLTEKHAAYLHKFNETRRMKRDAKIAETLPDPVRIAAGLPIGEEGAYFVGGNGFAGQEDDRSVIDHNTPPGQLGYDGGDFNERYKENERREKAGECQPGLWCQWIPGPDNSYIEWDGNEKFYNYIEWIKYLVTHFLAPWGYKVNGEVEWQGEDREDIGKIIITDNVVAIKDGYIEFK